jgi:Pyruvate/2-oxoacid:ferredoxin oxidoreductase gamma subunit
MIEIRIHGRGGQGGVTLAKLIATVRYLQGDSVQAFGVYAAERSDMTRSRSSTAT